MTAAQIIRSLWHCGESLIKDRLFAIIGALFIALSSCFTAFGNAFLPVDRLSAIKAQVWTKLVLILLAAIAALIIYHRFDNRLTLRYNIYWDRKKNPYCPSCKTPLEVKDYCTYLCLTCKAEVCASDQYRSYLPIEIVYKLLDKQTVTDEQIETIHNNHIPKGPTTYLVGIQDNRD